MSKHPPPPLENMNKKKETITTQPPGPPPPMLNSPLLRESKEKAKSNAPVAKNLNIGIDFSKVRTPFDISSPIDWDGIKFASVSESDSGADGVFFLQTKDDKIFVLKGSSYLGDEIFSSRISHFLGIRSPKTDLIEYRPSASSKRSDTESNHYGNDWWGAKVALRKCGKKNQIVLLKCQGNLYRAFYIIMEFIPGIDMFSKDFDRKKIFTSKKHLNDLGRIFVFDLVQNNSDRFPVPNLFKHEGNANNLLFLEDCVISIDQCVAPFNKPEQRDNYLNEVEKFVKMHLKNGFVDNIYIEEIVKFIMSNTLFEINEEGKKEIWKGMDDALKIIKEGKDLNVENLKKIKEELKGLLTGLDWENVYADSLKRIDCEFIGNILKRISENYK